MRDFRNVAVFGLSVALAFALGALVGRSPEPAWAQPNQSTYASGNVSSNNRMIAATGTVGSGMSVLWLVDTETNRLLVYGTSNLGKNVELRAARNIEYDTRLQEYNDESQYTPEDLEALWKGGKKTGKKGSMPKKPAPPPPKKNGEEKK